MMDKEALGDVIFSIDAAKEIIEVAIGRLEDCGLNKCDKKNVRICFSKTTEILNTTRDVLAFAKNG